MSIVYVNDAGAVISIHENQIVITGKDHGVRYLPVETTEGITLLSPVQMTTQATETCLKRGIQVAYFSKGGHYFGRLISTGHIRPEIQRKQSALYDTNFMIELSRRIIRAKMKNQRVVLSRYARNGEVDIHDIKVRMDSAVHKLDKCQSVAEIIGYEGQTAKAYFEGLSRCIDQSFVFHGRNRRPPRDPFNSMISLGYSILMNELYFEIEMKGLNPYFGFMHRDAERHPTLASDLMEEWRAIIVDATVMSLINGHEINKEQFYYDIDEPGCYLTKEGLKIYLSKLEKKFLTATRYLSYVDYSVSFRRAIGLQINRMVMAIEKEEPSFYEPMEIR